MQRIARAELTESPARVAHARLDAMVEAQKAYENALNAAQKDMVGAVLCATREILHAELRDGRPEVVEALVIGALRPVMRARSLSVQIHPDDLVTLPSAATLAERLGLLHVELVANSALERGDCVVESHLGDVDARISTKLGTLAAKLGERVHS